MLLEIVQNLKVLSSVLLVLSSHSSNFLITPRHAHISKVKTLFFKNYEKDITYNRASEKSLFISGFTYHSKICHSYGDVTITGEGLQIMSSTKQSRPFSSGGSLDYHTYCDTGHPFIMVISEDPWQLHL